MLSCEVSIYCLMIASSQDLGYESSENSRFSNTVIIDVVLGHWFSTEPLAALSTIYFLQALVFSFTFSSPKAEQQTLFSL